MTSTSTRSKRCEQRHHRECVGCGCPCHTRRNYDEREDGHAYESPVVETAVCKWCGVKMPQRAEGRPRKFCSPQCRVRAHRATPTLF